MKSAQTMIAVLLFVVFTSCHVVSASTKEDGNGTIAPSSLLRGGATASLPSYGNATATIATQELEPERRRHLGGDDCSFNDCSCKYKRYDCNNRNFFGTCTGWDYSGEDNWCRQKWGSKPQATIIQDRKKWVRQTDDCYVMKKCEDRTGSANLGDSIQIGEVGCEMQKFSKDTIGFLDLYECV